MSMDPIGAGHDNGSSSSDNGSGADAAAASDVASFNDTMSNNSRKDAARDAASRSSHDADDAAAQASANATNAQGKAGVDVSRGQKDATKARGELDAKQCVDHDTPTGQTRSTDMLGGTSVTGATTSAKTCHGVVSDTKGIGYGASAQGTVSGVSFSHDQTGITVDVATVKGDLKGSATVGADGARAAGQASVSTSGITAQGELGEEKEKVDVSVTVGQANADASIDVGVAPTGITATGKLGAHASCLDVGAKTTIDTDIVDISLSAGGSPCMVGGGIQGGINADAAKLGANASFGIGLGPGVRVGAGISIDIDAASKALDGLDMDSISNMFSYEPQPPAPDAALMP